MERRDVLKTLPGVAALLPADAEVSFAKEEA